MQGLSFKAMASCWNNYYNYCSSELGRDLRPSNRPQSEGKRFALCYRNGNSVIRVRTLANVFAPLWANGMDLISKITCNFVARNATPKAESAFPRLCQWLNRTFRSIVPKTPLAAASVASRLGYAQSRTRPRS